METWKIINLAAGVALGVFMLVAAVFLLCGKGAWLISGYNTMPKEKRKRYDAVALCKFMGKAIIPIAFLLPSIMAAIILEIWWLVWTLGGIFGLYTFFILVYANTGKRFFKKDETSE